MKQWNNWDINSFKFLVNHLNDPHVEHVTEYKHGAYIKEKKEKSIKNYPHLKGYLALL